MAFTSLTPLSPYTFVGATTGTRGAGGLVPTPNAGEQGKFLKGDGTWAGSLGAAGGGSNALFWENDQTMTVNYTITSGKNALSAGPITIADGITLTIPDSGVYTVV